MLKLLFLSIIIYIIIQQFLDYCNDEPVISENQVKEREIRPENYTLEPNYRRNNYIEPRHDEVSNKTGYVHKNDLNNIISKAKEVQFIPPNDNRIKEEFSNKQKLILIILKIYL